MWKNWDDLPENMKNDAVRPYYEILRKRKGSLFIKRGFDIVVSSLFLIILSPVFLVLSILIVLDSKGGVFYRQERVTQYGRVFKIHKFRTMVANAESLGTQVTIKDDVRITKIGSKLRDIRLDEIPQLIDILKGDMTFVGTRPESIKYVEMYTPEMMATLLLPAGVTGLSSIAFKDESELLSGKENVDEIYIKQILPSKMTYNLNQLKNFSFYTDIKLMFSTAFAVLNKNYKINFDAYKEKEDKEK